jgi:hypothetical protein
MSNAPAGPQQPPGWGPPPPPSQKRKRHVGRWILLSVLGLIALGVVVSLASGPSSVGTPAAKPGATAWKTVLRASGTASKRSPLFRLHGGQARLRYTFSDPNGTGALLGTVYVLKDGTELERDGGFPVVTVTEPGSDATEIPPGDGQYYLLVNAANARWSVTIEERG